MNPQRPFDLPADISMVPSPYPLADFAEQSGNSGNVQDLYADLFDAEADDDDASSILAGEMLIPSASEPPPTTVPVSPPVVAVQPSAFDAAFSTLQPEPLPETPATPRTASQQPIEAILSQVHANPDPADAIAVPVAVPVAPVNAPGVIQPVSVTPAAARGSQGPVTKRQPATPAVTPPQAPTTLHESGLTNGQVCDLILKQLYLQGGMMGAEIARNARLNFAIIDEGLRFLKDQRSIEVAKGDLMGRVSYRFLLTDVGRSRAREAFEQCRYVGPAPVPLHQYVEQCRRQSVAGTSCTPVALKQAFGEFIIRPGLLDELGPAVCSGRSIFVFGPPGNGKTMIAKGLGKFLNSNGGEMYVPYAIQTENSLITVFDPVLHQTTDDHDLQRHNAGEIYNPPSEKTETGAYVVNHGPVDYRWRRIRRPVVITGGELTLEMLELQYNKVSNFYSAPLHIKANGGVFLIDDFGRQLVSPRDLLNRWILPLEEKIDYLTLATGRKFAVPFEQLTIFSTNLDPKDLVDDAFLRRIRHKIRIDPPNREIYTQIFKLVCEQKQTPFVEGAIEWLYQNHYDRGRTPRSSDPRDLLEIAQSICRFRNEELVLTEKLMNDAAQRFFYRI